MADAIGVALLGAGNIGNGVIAALAAGAARYAARVGQPLEVRRVLVRDIARARPGVRTAQLTTKIEDVLADDATKIVIELLGGEEPARTYIEQSLRAGRHVVTANKEVMAKFGATLLQLAHDLSLIHI